MRESTIITSLLGCYPLWQLILMSFLNFWGITQIIKNLLSIPYLNSFWFLILVNVYLLSCIIVVYFMVIIVSAIHGRLVGENVFGKHTGNICLSQPLLAKDREFALA
jgi:hypothetical protein